MRVFSPTDTDIQDTVNAAFATNGGHNPPNHGQFSDARFAFLFKPGKYAQDIPIGYYTTVHGLGASPDDVVFTGAKGVYCEEGSYAATTGALDNFWRGAENFRSAAAFKWQTGTGMLWAVSQASPLRRVHVEQSLVLYQYEPPYYQAGYASGGFLADSLLEAGSIAGSQQQWFTRNVRYNNPPNASKLELSAWNSVFTGCTGATPPLHCGNKNPDGSQSAYAASTTPVIAEKPFVTVNGDRNDGFALVVPPRVDNSVGPSWSHRISQPPPSIDFAHVYVADPSIDTAATINAKIALPHISAVLLSPGIYKLTGPLRLNKEGFVLLGVGLATLVPAGATAAIEVTAPSCRVAGVLLQAGAQASPALLDVQSQAAGAVLQDVSVRVGGPDTLEVQAETMVHVAADEVIGDNLWLWRADHTVTGIVTNRSNPCSHGLVVDGKGVVMYGLAVEHTLADLTVWNGEQGQTFFYQSELPYDVTHADFGAKGFVGYRVAPHVQVHAAYGVGVYHYFRDYAVEVASAIVAPGAAFFANAFAVYLNGKGTITHVLNGQGSTTSAGGAHQAYVCP